MTGTTLRSIAALLTVVALAAGCSGPPAAAPPSATTTPSASASQGSAPSPPMSPLPSAASASPSAPPSHPASSSSWVEIGSLDTAPEWHIESLVGFAPGYVAVVNDDATGPPTIRFSTDGRSWRTVELPAPEPVDAPVHGGAAQWAVTGAAATDGRSVVVVGTYRHEPCDWTPDTGGPPPCFGSPISWVSGDGVNWRSSLPWVGPGQDAGTRGSGFGAVWAVPEGWEALLGYTIRSAGHNSEVWHSVDGITWERRGEVQLEDAAPVVVVGVEGRRLMTAPVWSTPLTETWTSDDGIGWTAEPFPDDLADVHGGVGPERPGEPWLLVGTTSAGPGARIPAIWSSSDLRCLAAAGTPMERDARGLGRSHEPGRIGLPRDRVCR